MPHPSASTSPTVLVIAALLCAAPMDAFEFVFDLVMDLVFDGDDVQPPLSSVPYATVVACYKTATNASVEPTIEPPTVKATMVLETGTVLEIPKETEPESIAVVNTSMAIASNHFVHTQIERDARVVLARVPAIRARVVCDMVQITFGFDRTRPYHAGLLVTALQLLGHFHDDVHAAMHALACLP